MENLSLNKEQRKQKIQEIIKGTPVTTIRIQYAGDTKELNVYDFPFSCLKFNPYNGRICSMSSEFEIENKRELDIENDKDQKFIRKAIWEIDEKQNEKTKKSLEESKQLKPGVISLDGIIIDGNRRASLILQLNEENTKTERQFRAAVLNQDYNTDRKQIELLETSIQIGEEEKVKYGTIEFYLKVKSMTNAGIDIPQIAKSWDVKESHIIERIDVLKLMEGYLIYIENEKRYRLLENTEDLFLKLNSILKSYQDHKGNNPDWKPNKTQLIEFKEAMFDQIRFVYNQQKEEDGNNKFDAKKIRELFLTDGNKSILSKKDLLVEFIDKHKTKIKPKSNKFNEENPLENFLVSDNTNVTEASKRKDHEWAKVISDEMKNIYFYFSDKNSNSNLKDKPKVLLEKASAIIKDIDIQSKDIIDILIDDYDENIKMADELRKFGDDLKKFLKSHNK
jgi:hypothetical protein